MYGAAPTTVLRPRASMLSLGLLFILTTICCVELVAHVSPVKSLEDNRTWAMTAIIPLAVTVIMSSCSTLPPIAVRIAIGYVGLCTYLWVVYRALSCVESTEMIPLLLIIIRSILVQPVTLMIHFFTGIIWIGEAFLIMALIEGWFRLKALFSFASSAIMLVMTIFAPFPDNISLLCRLCGYGFALTALAPVAAEVLEHSFPVILHNTLGHTVAWFTDCMFGWRLGEWKRRNSNKSTVSATSSDDEAVSRSHPVIMTGLDGPATATDAFGTRRRSSLPNGLGTLPKPLAARQGMVLPLSIGNGSKYAKKTLVLDLDETLVHSSSRPPGRRLSADLVFHVNINSEPCVFYVLKRPFVDWFMKQVCLWYNVIIFTASLKKYADPVIDMLQQNGEIKKRLFREACSLQQGAFLKDLSTVSQDLRGVLIIDNSPGAFSLQTENAIPIEGWYDDPRDKELLALLPLLYHLREVDDVRPHLFRLKRSYSAMVADGVVADLSLSPSYS